MKTLFLFVFLMFISSISYSQTINGYMVEYRPNAGYGDSTLFVILQIKLNDNENAVLGSASNMAFDYNILALQFVRGTFVNFNENDGYQTSTITCPWGGSVIKNIETHLVSGPGREVTQDFIHFIVFEFNIIDFSQVPWVCPRNDGIWFNFNSPPTMELCNWTIGEWLCYEANTPVELTSFSAKSKFGNLILNWTTATELNNLGFEIERRLENSGWERIGFVEGYGTTTEPREYSYVDDISGITANTFAYRLKQMDLDGGFEYSGVVEVDEVTPSEYELHQNYPNPFNPVTTISYSVPEKGFVTIIIYDVIGNEVATLVNEEQQAGNYSLKFNASELHSGAYFYRIQAVDFVETKKMILLK